MSYRLQCGISNIHDVFSLVVYFDNNTLNNRLEGIALELEIYGRITNPPKTIN